MHIQNLSGVEELSWSKLETLFKAQQAFIDPDLSGKIRIWFAEFRLDFHYGNTPTTLSKWLIC